MPSVAIKICFVNATDEPRKRYTFFGQIYEAKIIEITSRSG